MVMGGGSSKPSQRPIIFSGNPNQNQNQGQGQIQNQNQNQGQDHPADQQHLAEPIVVEEPANTGFKPIPLFTPHKAPVKKPVIPPPSHPTSKTSVGTKPSKPPAKQVWDGATLQTYHKPTPQSTTPWSRAPPQQNFKALRETWITEDKEEITSASSLVTCSSKKVGLYTAMWIDGPPVTIGEHYWDLVVSDLHDVMSFGVAERGRLKSQGETLGLFYMDKNLTNGKFILREKFGPAFKAGDEIGLLVSVVKAGQNSGQGQDHNLGHSSGQGQDHNLGHGQSHNHDKENRIKIYYYLNRRPLGLAFDVLYKHFPTGVYPCVQFRKAGFCRITQFSGSSIPQNRDRPTKRGLEGTWDVYTGSVKIDGKPFLPHIHLKGALMVIAARGRNQYEIFIHVIHSTWFTVIKKERTWNLDLEGTREREKRAKKDLNQSWGKKLEEEMERPENQGAANLVPLDGVMSEWLLSPDSVKVHGDFMTIVNGTSSVTFRRRNREPGPYSGDPFPPG